MVFVPFQLFQGEEILLPVRFQLVPVGQGDPSPAAALHLGTADDEPQGAEADAAKEGAAVEVGVVAQVLVSHGDLPAAQEGAEGGGLHGVTGEGHLTDGVIIVGAEEIEGGLLALAAHRWTGGVQQA